MMSMQQNIKQYKVMNNKQAKTLRIARMLKSLAEYFTELCASDFY